MHAKALRTLSLRYLRCASFVYLGSPFRHKVRTMRHKSEGSFVDSRVALAIAYMKEHLHESSLSLQVLSKAVGRSPWHFSRQFKAHTGIGCREFLRILRLARAALLLRTTLLSVKEISSLIGYKHISDFNHHFKRCYRISPVAFRRINSKIVIQRSGEIAKHNKEQELPKESKNYQKKLLVGR
jgi:AraC-like DNA-binding protein